MNLLIEFSYELGEDSNKTLKMKINNESLDEINLAYLLDEVGEKMITTSYREIILDLSPVTYISSSSIGSLMNIHQYASKNSKIVIYKFHEKIKEIIELTNFDRIAEVSFFP